MKSQSLFSFCLYFNALFAVSAAAFHVGKLTALTTPSTLSNVNLDAPTRQSNTAATTSGRRRNGQHHHHFSLQVIRSDLMYTDIYSVPLLLITALGVGIAAQSFINQMLEGEDGLGAFLSDGRGYNKSGFKSSTSKEIKKDPLPWLKLPELDFVEVAGQQQQKFRSEEEILSKLEGLRQEMNQAVEQGKMQEADAFRTEMEQIMKTYDIEYK